MKRLFAFVILLLTAVSAQYVSPGYNKGLTSVSTVLQTPTPCDGTTSCTVTFASNISAGSYIVVYVAGNGNGTGISATMTGETITHLSGASGCSNNTGFQGDCYLATNAVGGHNVLTCTASTASLMDCEAVEVSSPSGGHAKDVGGNAHSSTTAISVATSTASTNANDTCIGFAYGGGTGYSALNWTSLVNLQLTNGTFLMEGTIPGSTGTQTATATAASGSNFSEGVVCLKP